MKKPFVLTLVFLFSIISFTHALGSSEDLAEESEKKEALIPFGDPFIMLYENTYYAYGTHGEHGIEVYTSDDLLTWKKSSTLALHKDDSWGDRWFWAPEVYYIADKNQFFMYYSADEHICVATADSPVGPFEQTVKKPMIATEKCIDNSLFVDDDGKPYLYFDRFNDGLNIWVGELESDLKTIKTETLTPCIHVSQPWEEVHPRVNEGPFVVKHKGKYYMTYSGNSYESPFYGVGYAVADSPIGPWTKYEKNPILQKPEDLVGVGHSAMFRDKKGKLRIVFHAHYSKERIHPRGMYIADVVFTKGKNPVMKIGKKILRPTYK